MSLNLLVYSEHHLLLRLLSLQLCNEHLSLLIKKNNNKKKHDLSSKGFLIVEYMGKREQLPVNTKGSQVSPRLAEVVVKQVDPRWARQGATAALLKAAGYSTDVAVKTEYAGIFQHTCLAGPAILADLMWQRPRWQRQLQILLCASCPGPFSFKASRSASQSRAACKTSTSSAMQGQSIPQASRKPRRALVWTHLPFFLLFSGGTYVS